MYEKDQSLVHHGIKGQKWGVRRWQNEDGSYNEAGKKRYFGEDGNLTRAAKKHDKKVIKTFNKNYKKTFASDEHSATKYAQIQRELDKKYEKKDTSGYLSLDGRTYIPKTKDGEKYMNELNKRTKEMFVSLLKEKYEPTISSGYDYIDKLFDSQYAVNVIPVGTIEMK